MSLILESEKKHPCQHAHDWVNVSEDLSPVVEKYAKDMGIYFPGLYTHCQTRTYHQKVCIKCHTCYDEAAVAMRDIDALIRFREKAKEDEKAKLNLAKRIWREERGEST